MGVKGLWQLLEPVGRPVTLESLEGKVLSVDASLLLNQAVKGMRDKTGQPLPNAHLMVLFNRLCKLLFYRIKPVFVFDGGVPVLKKKTLAARKERKLKARYSSNKAAEKMVKNYLKERALASVTGRKCGKTIFRNKTPSEPDVFELPSLPQTQTKVNTHSSDSEEDDVDGISLIEELYSQNNLESKYQDPSMINVNSDDFRSLPEEIQHELIKDKIDDKKLTALTTLPQDGFDFSEFQLQSVLQRGKLHQRLDELRKTMNSRNTGEISGLSSQDSLGAECSVLSRRIVSEDTGHYILVKTAKHGNIDAEAATIDDSNEGGFLRENQPQQPVKPRQTPSFIDIDDYPNNSDSDINSPLLDVPEIEFPSSWTTQLKPLQATVAGKESKEGQEQSMLHDSRVGLNTLHDSRVGLNTGEKGRDTQEKSSELKGTLHDSRISNIGDKELDGRNLEIKPMDAQGKLMESEGPTRNIVEQLDKPLCDIMEGRLVNLDQDMNYIIDDSKNHEDKKQENNPFIDVVPIEDIQDNDAEIQRRKVQIELLLKSRQSSLSNHEVLPPVNTKSTDRKETKRADENSSHSIEHQQYESTPSNKEVLGDARRSLNVDKEMTKEPVDGSLDVDLLSETSTSMYDEGVSGNDQSPVDTDKNEAKPSADNTSDDFVLRLESSEDDDNDMSNKVQQNDKEEPVISDENLATTYDITMSDREDEVLHEAHNEETVAAETSEFTGSSKEDLEAMQRNLEMEQSSLQDERARQARAAASVSNEMLIESQELLRLFGVPYLVSPMEAEAQCAFLDLTRQTHGTITDDSDVFLFGGQKVYKHLFNQNKHPELYTSDAISGGFALDRSKLIKLALITGSDYTEGIQGLGAVGAMEVLHEFNNEGFEALLKFKKWHETTKNNKQKTQETKVKMKLRKINLPTSFPSKEVFDSYINPVIDETRGSFEWAKPDLHSLRLFAKEKLGWTINKTDELLLPVLKQLNNDETQKKLDSFFQIKFQETRKKSSQRVRRVVNRFFNPDPLSDESSSDDEESNKNTADKPSTSKLKGKAKVKPKGGRRKDPVPRNTRGRGRGKLRINKTNDDVDGTIDQDSLFESDGEFERLIGDELLNLTSNTQDRIDSFGHANDDEKKRDKNTDGLITNDATSLHKRQNVAEDISPKNDNKIPALNHDRIQHSLRKPPSNPENRKRNTRTSKEKAPKTANDSIFSTNENELSARRTPYGDSSTPSDTDSEEEQKFRVSPANLIPKTDIGVGGRGRKRPIARGGRGGRGRGKRPKVFNNL